MFIFKVNVKEKYLQGRTTKYLSKIVGITPGYFGNILNGKTTIPKATAYAITKAGNENAEIQDYFIRKGE